MSSQRGLIAHLLDAFPPKPFDGQITAQASPTMDAALRGSTWWAVHKSFAREHCRQLSLLTGPAYLAFLPAWLSEAALDPAGELTAQVLDNLRQGTHVDQYSSQQRYAIVYIANCLCEQHYADAKDQGEAVMAEIKRKWGEHGA